MGLAVGGSLIMALGIAITPVAITAVLLLLTTPKARTNGPAFLAGWLVALGVVGAIVLVIIGSTSVSHSGTSPAWASWLRIVLGILLLLVAIYQSVRHRPEESQPRRPQWAEKIGAVRPSVAFGVGAALAGARPKNIILIVGGVTAIVQAGISAGGQGIAYLIFAAVATVGVAIPIVIYFVMGDRASETLQDLEKWISDSSGPIISVLCLIIGVDLIATGITALT
jgi:Sap, sulfolipid-1-addressing protein